MRFVFIKHLNYVEFEEIRGPDAPRLLFQFQVQFIDRISLMFYDISAHPEVSLYIMMALGNVRSPYSCSGVHFSLCALLSFCSPLFFCIDHFAF